jgi:two-component system chemotaxis response regulator CheY
MARILIVDDSASMRNMVATTLQTAGHQIKDAADGQQALNTAQGDSFDVVITDLNMPVMNGIDLVRNLRGLSSYKYTPILLLTTESSMDKKSEGKSAGATGWLVKPFNPEKLLQTVNRVLS